MSLRKVVHKYSQVLVVLGFGISLFSSTQAFGQSQSQASEIEELKRQIQKLQEHLNRIEQAQKSAAAAAVTSVSKVAATAAPAGETTRLAPAAAGPLTENSAALLQDQETLQEPASDSPVAPASQNPAPAAAAPAAIQAPRDSFPQLPGIRGLEVGGMRFNGFFVGSLNYNKRIQLVPEFTGGAQALSDSGATNFRFDKFGLNAVKFFSPWLSASGAVEIEIHRDRHSHGFNPTFGCPGPAPCVERFGSETPAVEAVLDRFAITGIAPIGNGLSLSIGRFDVPFGIERHDEPLNLTATTSELFQFGRPNRMTGFQLFYPFGPKLDVTGWLVNRWENETTHTPFDDNNSGKSFGGRIGFTPLLTERLLNFGFGGWYGPEQNVGGFKRWLLDFDFSSTPSPRFLIAGEFIYGGEEGVSFRRRGIPFPQPARANANVNWWSFYVLPHFDIDDWFGVSFRYGVFDDLDGARTGVEQVLQSASFTPVFHLSRLIPEIGHTGTAYARTRHPINWFDLKMEYRFNHSNQRVFSDVRPAVDIRDARKTNHMLQLQLVLNF